MYTYCPFSFQITLNTTNAQPLGQQLVAFTSRAAYFTDVMDVIFVTHLVERLTRLVEKQKDVRTELDGKYPIGTLLQSGFESISTVESEQICP